jgi:hypothetical protein
MFHHFRDRDSLVNIAIQHLADKVNACFGERDKRHAERVVEDFFNVVEWVFLVDDRVEENAQGPHILLFASVGFALKDFGCCVV